MYGHKKPLENKITKPNYLGSIAFRFLIGNDHQTYFNKSNISLVMSSNCHLVAYPTNLDDLNIVMIARTPESNLQKLQEDTYIKNFLKTSILKDYSGFTRLENNNFKCWPIYFSQRAESSKSKNIFYLGDAFYAFPPTMAQGASQSIEASMELSKIIQSNSIEKTTLCMLYADIILLSTAKIQ